MPNFDGLADLGTVEGDASIWPAFDTLADLGGVDGGADFGATTFDGLADLGGVEGVGMLGVGPNLPAVLPPVVALYDEDAQYICSMTGTNGIQFQVQVSAPGSLSCRVPLDASYASDVHRKRWLKVFWKGAARQAARIDSDGTDVAVDGRIWREYSQIPGAMNALADVTVYPEYGLDRPADTQRAFGFMSAFGHWFTSGNWTAAQGFPYSDDTGWRKGKPGGFADMDPWWIAKNGPYNVEAEGQAQYFWRRFSNGYSMSWQLFATADDFLSVWVDGLQVMAPPQQAAGAWRTANLVTGTWVAGEHVIACSVGNARHDYQDNAMALILGVQQIDSKTGKVIANHWATTDDRWQVSDVYPGWYRGMIPRQLLLEGLARGVKAAEVISVGYGPFTDSRGAAWTDTPGEYQFGIGSTVLDAITQMAPLGPDYTVSASDLSLNAYVRLGTDRSGSVALQLGKDGGGIITHRVDVVHGRFNVALTQLADGRYVEQSDSGSVSLYGRAEVGVSLGSTGNPGTGNDTVAAQIAESAHQAITFTTTHSDLTGPQPFTSYHLGDSITVPDETATGTYKARVIAITVDFTGERPVITPELSYDPS
jgi:hypothetical protein